MKKLLSFILCLVLMFSIVGCSQQKAINNDENTNYSSTDVDENGNIIDDRNPFSTIESTTEDEETKIMADMVVHFIDCGNADSTFIELPNGESMLIDAGNNADGADICSYIEHLGYDSITYVIGTHPHEDHIGGLDDVIQSFDIEELYMPRIPDKYVPSTKTYKDVLTAVSNKNLHVNSPSLNQTIVEGDMFKAFFCSDLSKIDGDDMNKYSLVVRIEYYGKTLMFMGDADEEVESYILDNYEPEELDCDVLKVGHHGSYTASSKKFISTLSPKYAYIPCGEGNEYGHPHDVTLQTLNLNKVKCYRADLDGTVVMRINRNKIDIQTKVTGDIPLGNKGWDISQIKIN